MATELPKLISEKLKPEAMEAMDMFLGVKPRRYFIERVGAKSEDDLYEMLSSRVHSSNWERLWQQRPYDADDMHNNRVAVAFLESAGTCARRMYYETELMAHVAGMSRQQWRGHMLLDTKQLVEMKNNNSGGS